jgi:hypothetical protein
MTVTHSVILPAGVVVCGQAQEDGTLPLIIFTTRDGFGVTQDNALQDLRIQTVADQRAIFLVGHRADLGTFTFENLVVSGQLSFIMRAGSRQAKVTMKDIHVVAADTRRYSEQPQKYGVNVLQGALTVYNFNPDDQSAIDLHAERIQIGIKGAPVTGSGVFVAGFGDQRGSCLSRSITNWCRLYHRTDSIWCCECDYRGDLYRQW